MFKLLIPIQKSYKGKSGKLYVEGYASDPSIDRDEERFDKGAIESMVECVNKGGIPIRIEHENKVHTDVGEWEVAKMDKDYRLFVKGWIDTEMSLGKDIEVLLKRGKDIMLSVGGKVLDLGYEYSAELEKSIRVYKDILLEEISIIKNPSNFNTSLSMAKSVGQSQEGKVSYTTQAQKLSAIYKGMEGVPADVFAKIQKGEISIEEVLHKKELTASEKAKLKDADFAYITTNSKGEKVRKLPMHDKEHVKNALAVLAGARGGIKMPSKDRKAVKDKLLARAKELGMKMESTKKNSDQFQKWVDEASGSVNALFQKDWDEEVTTPSEPYRLSTQDLLLISQITTIMQEVNLPEDTDRPAMLDDPDYYENYSEEMQVVLGDRSMMFPHHNLDYSVNKELVLWSLKQLIDRQSWWTPKNYTVLITHLYRHLKELNLVKKSVKLSEQEIDLLKTCNSFEKGEIHEMPKIGETELTKEQVKKASEAYEKLLSKNLLTSNPEIMKSVKKQVTSVTKEEDVKEPEEVVETPAVEEAPVVEETVVETPEEVAETPVAPEEVEEAPAVEEAPLPEKSYSPKEVEAMVQKGLSNTVTKAELGAFQKSLVSLTTVVEGLQKSIESLDVTKKVTSLEEGLQKSVEAIDTLAKALIERKSVARYSAVEKSFSNSAENSVSDPAVLAEGFMKEDSNMTFSDAYKKAKEQLGQ